MKVKLLLLVFLMIQSVGLTAQTNRSLKTITENIHKLLFMNVNHEGVRDSIAVYTTAIKLDIIRGNSSANVKKISVSDSIAYSVFNDLTFLKAIDFAPLAGAKDSITVIIPIAIMMEACNTCSPGQLKLFSRSDYRRKILNLFFNTDAGNSNPERYIYLKPYTLIVNNKVDD